MQPVTNETIEAIADVWYEADRHERYYQEIRKQNQRWNIGIKFVKIPSAIVAIVLLILLVIPDVDAIDQTLFIVVEIIFLVIYFVVDGIDRLFKFFTKHDVLDHIVSGVKLLNAEIKELWYKIHATGMFEHEASTQYQKLTRSLEWLLFVPDKFISEKSKLRDKSQKKAYETIMSHVNKRKKL